MDLAKEILDNSHIVAVIGIKKNEWEDAFKIPFYMKEHGYKIIGVNPKFKGDKILGSEIYDKVTEIKEKIDVVNIFRKPEFLKGHAEEILQMNPLPKYVWFQLGIYNDKAAKVLEAKG